MPVIKLETYIHTDIETCFDLSRSIDLHSFSTAQTREKAIAGKTSGLIGADETVTWQATHFGVRQRLTSKITAYNRPFHFRDEQLRGAFRFIKHDHYFSNIEDGTLMTDIFCFQSPLGLLGRIVDAVVMKHYLARFLAKRNDMIKNIAESGTGAALLEAERALHIREQNGAFAYTNDGFILQNKFIRTHYAWSNIETVFAYKEDLVTTDEICLDLFTTKGICVSVSESCPGWKRFLEQLSDRLPAISENWEQEVGFPAFKTNFIRLFDRQERTPEQAEAVCYANKHKP
ncbi:MAG: SRPBCC family protein [Niabella sp.]|nr:SRPBCC family protein [Niabella sp.]